MKHISVRIVMGPVLNLVVEDKDVVTLAGVLESAPSVINFKVHGDAADGISQKAYGCGGFTKWAIRNYEEETL